MFIQRSHLIQDLSIRLDTNRTSYDKRRPVPSHPGLAEINAPVGPWEVVGHTLNSQLLIG